jgi:peptidoglycan/LPS O-acetylase OafA/YrhL
MDRSAAEVDRSLERGHILALDGLRGIAILLVVVCHFQANLGISADGRAWPLVAIAHAGWMGVDLFFVLSGFLITGILVDARGSDSYFSAFYARRALRILPVYYGFLFAIFVLLPLLHLGAGDNYMLARQHQAWYWLHTTNIMMAIDELPGRGPYPSTLFWSLAVEEQFYFIWPAVVALCSPRVLRKVCIGGVIGCIVLRVVGGLTGVSGLALSVLPFTRGDTLFIGGLLAIEYRHGGLGRYRGAAKLAAIASVVVLAGLIGVYGQLDYNDRGTAMFGSIAIMALGASAVIIGISSTESRFAHVLKSGFLRFFGRYSYAMYVFHGLLHKLIGEPWLLARFGGAPPVPLALIYATAVLLVSYLLGYCSYQLLEKHFLKLKPRIELPGY